MHSFTADGKHLVIFDGFGLSRLTLPKAVKTDKISGHWLSGNDGLVLVHNESMNARAMRTVPELTIVKVDGSYELKYGPAVPLDDKHVLTADGTSVQVVKLINGKPLGKHDLSELAGAAARAPERIDLGPQLAQPSYKTIVAAGDDGAFALWSPLTGQLFLGRLPKPSAAPVDVVVVHVGAPQGLLQLRVVAGGVFVAAFHGAQNKAWCAVVDARGGVTARVVDSVAPVAFADGKLISQPDDGTVLREPLVASRGGSGDAERFTLKTRAPVAELMAHGSAIWALAADRESFIDVVSGAVVDRKLPAAEKATRAGLRGFIGPYQQAARAANLTIFPWLKGKPAGKHEQGYSYDRGDDGLLGILVMSNVFARCRIVDGGRWRVGSYSSGMSLGPVDVDAVRRALEAADQHGLDLLSGMALLASPLSSAAEDLERTTPVFSPDAARLLLAAVIARLAGAKTVANTKVPASLTPEEVIAQLDPLVDVDGWSDAQTPAAFLVAGLFGKDAVPVLVDWLVARRSYFAINNTHILVAPVEMLMKRDPELTRTFRAAVDRAAAAMGDKGEEAAAGLRHYLRDK
ncbi:MAG: hypothetical protein Q8O67_22655 [Deltaproteobacteria bacterium]|nr:hypothetical protein [Deltaproteobacteria bacterium]